VEPGGVGKSAALAFSIAVDFSTSRSPYHDLQITRRETGLALVGVEIVLCSLRQTRTAIGSAVHRGRDRIEGQPVLACLSHQKLRRSRGQHAPTSPSNQNSRQTDSGVGRLRFWTRRGETLTAIHHNDPGHRGRVIGEMKNSLWTVEARACVLIYRRPAKGSIRASTWSDLRVRADENPRPIVLPTMRDTAKTLQQLDAIGRDRMADLNETSMRNGGGLRLEFVLHATILPDGPWVPGCASEIRRASAIRRHPKRGQVPRWVRHEAGLKRHPHLYGPANPGKNQRYHAASFFAQPADFAPAR